MIRKMPERIRKSTEPVTDGRAPAALDAPSLGPVPWSRARRIRHRRSRPLAATAKPYRGGEAPMADGVAFIDGEYSPAHEARIPLFDLGFTRGDAVYDTVSVWH